MKKSLKEICPHHWEVPVLLLVSQVILLIAFCLPLMKIEKQVLWKKWKNEYSVITGVTGLVEQKEHVLAATLFFFSIVFPLVKLGLLWFLWIKRLPEAKRKSLLHWLGILGKWSMLDVFVVAMLIVLVKLGPLVKVEPQAGVYVFAAAILLSMLTTMYISHLARKH